MNDYDEVSKFVWSHNQYEVAKLMWEVFTLLGLVSVLSGKVHKYVGILLGAIMIGRFFGLGEGAPKDAMIMILVGCGIIGIYKTGKESSTKERPSEQSEH